MSKKYILLTSIVLLSTPLMANKLVCPALTYSDIKHVTKEGGDFDVGSSRFSLTGFASLPNWMNPITKRNFAPEIVNVEHEDTARLKCNYTYKTLIGKSYKFSIQAVIENKTLMALAALGYQPNTTYAEMQKGYRKKALSAHPDKGGSTDAMQKLNSNWDNIKMHFGM